MDYTVLHIAVSDDEQAEILTAELADFPFESFETEGGLLKAYIPAVRLSGCKTDVDALLARRGSKGVMPSSRPKTGAPPGRAISRRSTSKAACASAPRYTIRLLRGIW